MCNLDGAVLSVISRTDKAGVMRSDVTRDVLSAKTRLGLVDRREQEESGQSWQASCHCIVTFYSRRLEEENERKERQD